MTALIFIVISVFLAGLSTFFIVKSLNKDNSKNQVNNQVVDNDTSNDVGSDIATSNSSEVGPYIKDGYFIVPHWGQKFKLSDDLTDYGYSVSPDSLSHSYDSYVVGLTAMFKKDLQSNPQAMYYATIDFCSFVTVSKTTKDMSNVVGPKKVIPFDEYSFVVYDFNAHGGCVDQGFGLMTTSYYNQVANKLTDILSSPENIY